MTLQAAALKSFLKQRKFFYLFEEKLEIIFFSYRVYSHVLCIIQLRLTGLSFRFSKDLLVSFNRVLVEVLTVVT